MVRRASRACVAQHAIGSLRPGPLQHGIGSAPPHDRLALDVPAANRLTDAARAAKVRSQRRVTGFIPEHFCNRGAAANPSIRAVLRTIPGKSCAPTSKVTQPMHSPPPETMDETLLGT